MTDSIEDDVLHSVYQQSDDMRLTTSRSLVPQKRTRPLDSENAGENSIKRMKVSALLTKGLRFYVNARTVHTLAPTQAFTQNN